jgi:hypothetical protein
VASQWLDLIEMLTENVATENFIILIIYCRCGEAVKLFRFLLSPYSLIGTCICVQNCSFRDCTGTFIAYCMCREAVKLFRFLLSPYSLIGAYDNVQNCTFCSPADMAGLVNV